MTLGSQSPLTQLCGTTFSGVGVGRCYCHPCEYLLKQLADCCGVSLLTFRQAGVAVLCGCRLRGMISASGHETFCQDVYARLFHHDQGRPRFTCSSAATEELQKRNLVLFFVPATSAVPSSNVKACNDDFSYQYHVTQCK